MLRSGAPPINRLYVKNLGEAAIEDARVEITSSPEFLLPYSAEARLPGKSTLRFEPGNIVSPLFTAAPVFIHIQLQTQKYLVRVK